MTQKAPAAAATPYAASLAELQETEDGGNQFAEAALERHKHAGMELAVKARWVAMALIAIMLPFINFDKEIIFYYPLLALFCLIGWIQMRVARVGRSNTEILLILGDMALMTIALVAPNPLSDNEWPRAMQYRFEGFMYFYILLAAGTLAFSWRTVRGIGTIVAVFWLLATWNHLAGLKSEHCSD